MTTAPAAAQPIGTDSLMTPLNEVQIAALAEPDLFRYTLMASPAGERYRVTFDVTHPLIRTGLRLGLLGFIEKIIDTAEESADGSELEAHLAHLNAGASYLWLENALGGDRP